MEDSHDQDIIHAIIKSTVLNDQEDHRQLFLASPVEEVRLSTLRGFYETGNTSAAMRVLSRRRFLTVDNELKFSPNDKDVLTRVHRHFLDYVLFVGNRTGLDAALPNTGADHTLEFRLNFCYSHRLWPSANINDLPFNPQGRMMFVGTRRQEQIWIAMIPKQLFHRGNEGLAIPTLDATTTALSTNHGLMLTLFFAFALDFIGFQDVHCRNTHPLPVSKENVRRVTDIL